MSFATSLCAPITVASSRAKANPFRRPSILFRPHDPQTKDFGGAAGYRPRVRSAYYERVYCHSSEEHSVYSKGVAEFEGCAPSGRGWEALPPLPLRDICGPLEIRGLRAAVQVPWQIQLQRKSKHARPSGDPRGRRRGDLLLLLQTLSRASRKPSAGQ